MGIADIGVIGLYIIGMVVLGVVSKGKIQDMDDFILGGKRFNIVALTGTVMATMIGSGMTMGSVGNAYNNGMTGTVAFMYAGFGIGLLTFAFMTKKIRDTGKRSMAEVIGYKFGKTSRLISSIVIIGYAVTIVAINIAGIRTIIMAVFGDSLQLSPLLVTALGTLLAIFYTSMGGLTAVAWMDTIQLCIIIVGIVIIAPIIGLNTSGGFAPIAQTFESMGMSMTNPLANGVSSTALGLFLAYFLMVPGDPAMPQRALAGRSDKTAKNAFLISGVMAFVFGFSLIMIGASTRYLSPDLANSEHALIHFVVTYFPPVLKGLTIVGVFGAVISSFDSFLILATTHLIYDVGGYMGIKADEKQMNRYMSIFTVVIGVIGLIIALFITSLFDYLYMVFSVLGSALVPTFLGAILFRDKCSRFGANLSLIVGTIVPAVLYLTVGYDVFLGDPVFLGLLSSIAALVIGSIAVKDKPADGGGNPAVEQA